MIDALLDAPIPGENYTSDTKNYPWHRPPELTDMDAAIDWCLESLTEEEAGFAMLTLIEAGTTIVTAADIFVTIGIAKGKWTPDFAILLAGPVARILEIMAKAYEIDYRTGLDSSPPRITSKFLKEIMKEQKDAPVEAPEEVAAPTPAPVTGKGLMGAPEPFAAAPEDEQMSMLGYGPEEPVDQEQM